MYTLEELRKLSVEEQNTLNLERNVVKQLTANADIMMDDFFLKYEERDFNGPIKKEIIDASNNIRNSIMNMLESKCSEILKQFNEDYENFCVKFGWYENLGAKIRHKITRDELAYELCEIIRKIYYVYVEDRFPNNYKIDIVETYLLKET